MDTPVVAPAGPRRRPWILAGGLVAAVVLWGCLPLLSGRAAPLWDANAVFGPSFSLVADYAKAGRLEVWDPWVNAGAPDFAEPQLGTASPVLLTFALLSPHPFSGFIAYWLALWVFGGIGMLLLCRHLGAPAWGAVVIALGFAACGVYAGNAEHTSWICSLSFLPWTLWRFDRSLEERSYWYMAQAGVLWGLSALGGYPGVTITTLVFLASWGVGRAWTGGSAPAQARRDPAGRRVTHLATALLVLGSIGFAVMSPAYVSFLRETHGYTFRADAIDRAFALGSNALTPAAYASLASPALYLLRESDQRAIWPDTDISMSNVYMGVLVTVLALVALGRPSRWRIWLALLAVGFGCCAVGSHLPVRGWLYDLVPPTRYFRHPALFRIYVIVGACALAAYASRDIETWWHRPSHARSGGGVAFLISALAAVVAVLAYSATLRSIGHPWSADPSALAQLLLTWLAAASIFFLVWKRRLPHKAWVAALVILAAGDAAATLVMCRPTMFESVAVPQWNGMSEGHVSSLDLRPNGWARSLFPPEAVGAVRSNRNVALKAATLSGGGTLKNRLFQLFLDDLSLGRIAIGTERVWFSDRPVWLAPTEANFAAFADASHARGFPSLVLHTVAEMQEQSSQPPVQAAADGAGLQAAPALVAAHTDLVVYEPEALAFRYHADRDGWLLVTDRWASAWTATVNGREQPVLGGNFVFRAIAVSRGDNLVEFRYQPRGYFGWVALSWSIVGLAAIWQIRRWRRPVSLAPSS